MKTDLLLFMIIIIVLSACVQNTNKPEQTSDDRFRINEAGDTVLLNYRSNGSLLSEITIKNGMKNGLALNYYENGQVQYVINYKNNEKDGRVVWNYESGKLYRESVYVKGEVEGIQKLYYEDGKLMAEVPYKHGKLSVGTKEYTKEGKLKKSLPDLILEPVDRMAFDDKYLLRISLSRNASDVSFFRTTIVQGVSHDIPVPLNNGIAELSWIVRKDAHVMEKVTIAAEFVTASGSPVRLEKTYNLAVEHR